MPGEGLTPEAALPGCPHEPRAHICRACYAAALLAAEARGREQGFRLDDVLAAVDGYWAMGVHAVKQRIRALATEPPRTLAPLTPKAAPPADAGKPGIQCIGWWWEGGYDAAVEDAAAGHPGMQRTVWCKDGGHSCYCPDALARSAPPAPAASGEWRVCDNCKRAAKAKDGRTDRGVTIGPCYCDKLRPSAPSNGSKPR